MMIVRMVRRRYMDLRRKVLSFKNCCFIFCSSFWYAFATTFNCSGECCGRSLKFRIRLRVEVS